MNVTIVEAERRTRRYDDERGCYVYDISFKTRVPLTDRTAEVAEAFGLGIDMEKEHVIYRDFELKLAEGDVVYITGDSGSGKSVLLRALREDLGEEATSLEDIQVDLEKPLIDTVGDSFREALTLLSRVGLNDAFLFLRKYRQLSDGQRYRYRIARMIDSGKSYWLCDEFCSTLDRTTARIVAFNIQKLARRTGSTLVVATTHTDLEMDLNPSILIRKGWGEEIEVNYVPNSEASECSISREITLHESSKEEYGELAYLHYRNEKVPIPYRFYSLKRGGELVGVIAYSYPAVNTSGRRKAVGYRPDLEELNSDWCVISRVIVHPKYRTTGLGKRLVKETLPLQGRKHVEMIAVMAQYNPFAEKAGMKLVTLQEPHKSVVKALERLKEQGFNPTLMASEGYNHQKLEAMEKEEYERVKEVLRKVSSQYNKRLARKCKPYVRKQEYLEWLSDQPPESLAKTLRTLSILNQTKAYLYWCSDWLGGGVDVE